MKLARIAWSTDVRKIKIADILHAKEPGLPWGCIGAVDGLNLPVQVHSNINISEPNYNGWLHGYYVSSVCVFGFDSNILWCRYNCPGSWHDARIAAPLFEILQDDTPSPFYIVGDSAFPKFRNKIMRCLKPSTVERYEQRKTFSEERIKELKILHNMVTSVRQSAEWGMGSLQKQFPRITLPLPHNADKRALVLECCFRLYNFRNRMGGRNQIRTSFDPAWILELNFACV
eukprot:g30239.t1